MIDRIRYPIAFVDTPDCTTREAASGDASASRIPHSVAVTLETYEEEPKVTRIDAKIRCAREGQRGIIIGKRGELGGVRDLHH